MEAVKFCWKSNKVKMYTAIKLIQTFIRAFLMLLIEFYTDKSLIL